MIIDIKKSKDTYLAVEDKISEYIPLTEDVNHTSRLFEKLSQKGWKKEDFVSFIDVIPSLFRIRDFYRKNIYNSLIYRYHTISNFGVNENAKEVLIKIIINAITNFLANERTLNITHPWFSEYHHRFENLSKPIMEEIVKMYKPINPPYVKVISNRSHLKQLQV